MQKAALIKGCSSQENSSRDGLTSQKQSRPIEIHLSDTDMGCSSLDDQVTEQIIKATERCLSHSETAEAEVDTSDYRSVTEALHLASTKARQVFRGKLLRGSPNLTLSAFRRPETAVRLTQCDPSRTLESEYNLHAPNCGILGHGAFACVRLAIRRRDGIKVAVKTIAKHEALRSHRLRISGRTYLEEWEILRRLNDNSYIVSLLDVFESDEEIQLVTEYCRGGELFNAIQKKRNRANLMRRGQNSEAQAASITKQILHALDDIHARGIVHRDVKPENILLVDSDDSSISVKLCDFGIARLLHQSSDESDGEASPLTPPLRMRSFSFGGTDYYMAPEVRFGGDYDTPVDMYSLGVTLYILLCGFPPVFSGNDSDEVIFPNTYWKDISCNAKDLVRKMLVPDVSERISARESLQHTWISSCSLPDRPPSTTVSELPLEREIRLDLVTQRLYKCLGTPKVQAAPSRTKRARDEQSEIRLQPARKCRYERRASVTLMALADLYRGVAVSVVPSVAAIAAAGSLSSSPAKERKASFSTGSTVAALSF
jgi:serine/threonine protein kinase